MKFLLVTYLILNGLFGAESHVEMKSNDKSEVSSLTSSAKISNVLRDVLNQESLVRFSMTQRIQSLFMDALDNKNNSLILKQKLNDLSAELQSITAENQKMKEENAQLKQELDTVKQEMKTFITQQIQNLKRTEIRVLQDESSKFKQELNNLKMTSSNNKQQYIHSLNNINESLSKSKADFMQQFQMINDSLQEHDSQLQSISAQQSSSKSKADFMQQFQMINDSLQEHDSQLQSISAQQSSMNWKHLLHKSCMGILQSYPDVKGQDGVYSINVGGQEKKVYCDMTTDGGGWTVIQKREDGSTDFFRNWTDYKQGFGDPSKNYWIGNDAIHTLTVRDQELRVDLQAFDKQTAYASYSEFKVGNESTKYQLTVGGYSGTAGDSLIRIHNGHKFSTRDQDNDGNSYDNCAVNSHGAWWYGWYKNCADSNLNGQYVGYAMYGHQYPSWYHWKNKWEALKSTRIMIRPKS